MQNVSLKCMAIKNSISHDDAERVSQTYRPSAILDLKKLSLTAGAHERHVLYHYAKFCGDRPC